MSKGCTVKVAEIQGKKLESPRTPEQCKSIKDALAKDIFNNLFNWIVTKLNVSLVPSVKGDFTSVGMLDIFGF